jgi:hypothetical protein
MEVQSILISQIVADVVLCLAILFLLLRMGRIVNRTKSPVIDKESLLQFQQLLNESRGDVDRLFGTLDESYRKFNELAMSLEVQEGRLRDLVEKINRQTEKFEIVDHIRDEEPLEKKYGHILKLLEEGLPLENIAEKTGIASGEILLIADLEKTKKRKHKTNSNLS